MHETFMWIWILLPSLRWGQGMTPGNRRHGALLQQHGQPRLQRGGPRPHLLLQRHQVRHQYCLIILLFNFIIYSKIYFQLQYRHDGCGLHGGGGRCWRLLGGVAEQRAAAWPGGGAAGRGGGVAWQCWPPLQLYTENTGEHTMKFPFPRKVNRKQENKHTFYLFILD